MGLNANYHIDTCVSLFLKHAHLGAALQDPHPSAGCPQNSWGVAGFRATAVMERMAVWMLWEEAMMATSAPKTTVSF